MREASLHGNQQQSLRGGFFGGEKTVLAGQGPQARIAKAEAQIPIPVSEEAGNVQPSSYHKARGMLLYPLSSFRAMNDQLKSTCER